MGCRDSHDALRLGNDFSVSSTREEAGEVWAYFFSAWSVAIILLALSRGSNGEITWAVARVWMDQYSPGCSGDDLLRISHLGNIASFARPLALQGHWLGRLDRRSREDTEEVRPTDIRYAKWRFMPSTEPGGRSSLVIIAVGVIFMIRPHPVKPVIQGIKEFRPWKLPGPFLLSAPSQVNDGISRRS